MREIVICNPTAGGGRAAALARGLGPGVRTTAAPGDATALARGALEDGVRRVAVVGGDGTVHEVVQGLFADGPPPADLTLTVLGGGTSGDFARGIAGRGALRRDLIALECADGVRRYAVNGVNLGFIADATAVFLRGRRAVGAARRLSNDAGQVLAGLATVARRDAAGLAISVDGAPPAEQALWGLSLFKTPTIGGGMRFGVPVAPDDGRAVLCRLQTDRRARALAAIASTYRPGGVAASREVAWCRLTTLAVETHRPLLVEADGELLGTTPLRCTVIPRALVVAAPAVRHT